MKAFAERKLTPLEITLREFDRVAKHDSAEGLEQFLNYVVIDARPPTRFNSLLKSNPWQRDLLNILVPLFELAAGFRKSFKKRGVFITAPRGHSKTSILAILICWALNFAKRSIVIDAAAADRDQAAILLDRCRAEAKHNPWLLEGLDFQRNKIYGPKGELTIHASDAPGSAGLLADITVVDELTCHKDDSLFNMLLTGRNKRTDGVFVIISNAGVIGSWQHNHWLLANESDYWSAHEVPAFSANWLDREAIEEDRKALPPSHYKRLHENQWVLPGVDNQFVTRKQLLECIGTRTKESEPTKDKDYVLSVDYGITQDRTAMCVCHMEDEIVILDKLDCWQGTPENRVRVEEIEKWVDRQFQVFNIVRVVLDIFQLEALAQKLESRVPVERINFGGTMLTKLSENLRSLILNNRLSLYPRAGLLPLPNGRAQDLIDEMEALVIVERASGWRFDHNPGEHDDRTVVIALASYALVRLAELLPCRIEMVDDGLTQDKSDIPWEAGLSSPTSRLSGGHAGLTSQHIPTYHRR